MFNKLRTKIFGYQNPDSPDYVDPAGRKYWLGWNNRHDNSVSWHYVTNKRGDNQAALVELAWSDDAPTLTLGDIRIKPDYWRRGFGTFLINKVKALADELGKTEIVGLIGRLDIQGHPDSNFIPQPELPSFYDHHGFVVEAFDDSDDTWWGQIKWTKQT